MMNTKAHQGVINETVTITFDNGYRLTLDKGIEIALIVVISDSSEIDELKTRIAELEMDANPGRPDYEY